MRTTTFELTGHNGDRLAARLDKPDGPILATALFAHCFTCSKDLKVVRRIAGHLTTHGIAVLRFDFTGLGHSEGEFANTNFSSNVDDLVLAAEALSDYLMAPQLIIGHSFGGTAAIQASRRIESLSAMVTIGAPADPAHITHQFKGATDDIETKGEASVSLADRSFTIKKQFLDDVSAHNIQATLEASHIPYLILHSTVDAVVDIDQASQLFVAARHPKSFISLDQADHLLTNAADAEYAAGLIGAWATRYIDLKSRKEPATNDSIEPEAIWVSESDSGGLRQDISVGGRHSLVADEPTELGGQDTGPNPYDFLCVALGACTSMTIRMVAKHKKLALTHVAVEVRHHKNEEKTDVFERFIRLEGDLSDDEHKRLLEIADRCPIHRTLQSNALIETHPWLNPETSS